MWGKISNGCCILYEKETPGAKPIVYSTPEQREGYYAYFRFVDSGETITQEWNYRENTIDPEKDVDDSEALRILLGGAT